MSVYVKVSYNSSLHRFTLRKAPSFLSLCEDLVHTLRLRITGFQLADAARSPFSLWFLDDERDYCRLFDDLSLKEALRLSPQVLRLLIGKAATAPSASPNIDDLSIIMGDTSDREGVFVPVQFSYTTFLKLLSHLKKNGKNHVRDAVDNVYDSVDRHSKDSRTLRGIRHDLSSLFSNFLGMEMREGSAAKIADEGVIALIKALKELMRDAGVSRSTIEASARAVRVVLECRSASELIRRQYRDMLTESARRKLEKLKDEKKDKDRETDKEDIVRPVKHYMNQFVKLMRVAGKDAQDAYEAFAVAKRGAENAGAKFELTRALCKGIQRAAFHFLRWHVSEGTKYAIETRAIASLSTAVCRKLKRLAYDERVLEAVRKFVVALVMDSEVVRLAYEWANRSEKPQEVSSDDERDLPKIGRRNWEWEDRYASASDTFPKKKKKKKISSRASSWASRNENVEGVDRYDHHRALLMKHRPGDSSDSDGHVDHHKALLMMHRRGDKSDSDNSTSSSSESEEVGGRSAHYRSFLRRRRRASESDSNSSSSSETLKSMHESELDKGNSYRSRFRNAGRFSRFTSPMDSSEDPRHRKGDPYESDAHKSSDTHQSKWARVDMDGGKERDQHNLRRVQSSREQIARERQMERERQMDIQLARERRQDLQPERRPDVRRYGSRRQSYDRPAGEYYIRPMSGSRAPTLYTAAEGYPSQRYGEGFENPRRLTEDVRPRPDVRHGAGGRPFFAFKDIFRDNFASRNPARAGLRNN